MSHPVEVMGQMAYQVFISTINIYVLMSGGDKDDAASMEKWLRPKPPATTAAEMWDQLDEAWAATRGGL